MNRRIPFAALPTPCEAVDRLGAAIGLAPGQLLVKRDDLTGLAGGGNKVRKLELLVGDALDQGCDTLVTGGGRQSNHVRMTAAAANKVGLRCRVVLASHRPEAPSGNVLLDELLRPELVWAGPLDYYPLEERIELEAEQLREDGRRPYVLPVGGASPVGALGYVHCVDELRAQVPDIGLVVVADGSGGTHAGLAAGLGDHGLVLGVDVGTRPDLDDSVPAMAAQVAALDGRAAPAGKVQVDHESFGEGYGAPTDAARAALDLAATLEGLLLDPVYTGKGMVGLITAARSGRIGDRRTVFIHTGGLPALFSPRYAAWVRELPRQ
ncbi:MAG: D-cysteine desulfhydrase [Acidimicrobiaceae bacterium]|jgi:D-cysteine desulfhydrase family pyridoxal phosphate-dependent enzyme